MRQPKTLSLLASVQMWKFFSHYGMRALLVLYLVEKLYYSDFDALGINALFVGLVELSGIFGGVLADRYLGLRRASLLGALLLSFGYMSLVFEKGFFFSLSLIVLGASLFSSNVTALLGETYEEEDPRRKRGFTLFYMMQNLGALISTALCGVIATRFGFRAGFLFCASGMVVGCAWLWLRQGLLKGLGEPPEKPQRKYLLLPVGIFLASIAFFQVRVIPLLPWLTVGFFLFFAVKLLRDPALPKEKVRLLFVYLGALILFFAAEDQICSSLMLFAERESHRTFFGWTIPSAMIMSLNPVVILLLGTVIAKFRFRMILPFVIVALAFATLRYTSVFGVIVMISIAELMIGPLIFSFASEVAAKGQAGIVMGMIPIAFSLAFLFGGGVSKIVAIDKGGYGAGFGKIAAIILLGGIVLEVLIRRFSHEKSAVY